MMRWLAFVACSCIPTFDLNPRKAGSVMYFGMIVVMAIVLVMVTVALAVIVINIYNGDSGKLGQVAHRLPTKLRLEPQKYVE